MPKAQSQKPTIYLDHASATYVDPRVLEAMLPYFSEKYGNPSSLHQKGIEAKITVDTARETVAKILNCKPREIIFCGSATEANNLAIFGVAKTASHKGKHIITSKVEHSSVRAPFEQLEKEGFKVTFLDVDKYGTVEPKTLQQAITKKTTIVSIIYGNNEIGTIEPIPQLAEICRKNDIPFHTDAAQCSYENLNVEELKVDLMTLNGGKMYGPKGVGVLYKKDNINLEPIIYGGGHENQLRAGTLNVPLIVSFAKALELAQEEAAKETKRLVVLRDKLIEGLLQKIPNSRLNGHPTKRLANNVNIVIPDINAQELLLHLDEAGIFVSSGSACKTGIEKPSQILLAIGLPAHHVHSSLRMTLGKKTNEKDINYVIETLPKIVEKIRKNIGFKIIS